MFLLIAPAGCDLLDRLRTDEKSGEGSASATSRKEDGTPAASPKEDGAPWDPASGAAPPVAKPPRGSWMEFRSDEAGFSARFPAAPKASTVPTPSVLGNLDQKMFSVEKDDAFYAVTVTEYPAEAVAGGDVATMLDGARDGAVANVKGKLVREEQLKVEGFPCRKMEVLGGEQGIKLEIDNLMCVVDHRLLQAVVVRPVGGLTKEQVERFLASLKPHRE